MAKVHLNDKSVRKAPPQTGVLELWDKGIDRGAGNFGVRINAGGKRSYQVMGRVGGKLVRYIFADAPGPEHTDNDHLPAGCLSPAQARRQALELLDVMAGGKDPRPPKGAPGAKKQAAMAAEPAADSFKAVADLYLNDKLAHGGANLASKPELERKLAVDLKAWHHRPIASLTKPEINTLVRAKAQVSPVSANRLLSFIQRVCNYAVANDLLDYSRAALVPKPSHETPRQRNLSEAELKLIWDAAGKLGAYGRVVRLLILTGQRKGEVAGITRAELCRDMEYELREGKKQSFKTAPAWIIPGHRTKRGKSNRQRGLPLADHEVALSPLALKLIADAPELKDKDGKAYEHVLASGGKGDKPIDGWSKYKVALNEEIGRLIAQAADAPYDAETHKIPEWNLHDLRGAFAIGLDRLGYEPAVASRCLNHAEGDRSMTRRYQSRPRTAEAVEAWNEWADKVAQIVGLNVIELKKSEG